MSNEREKRFTEDFMASWKRSSEDDIPPDKKKILEKQAELLKKNPNNERIWFARGVLFSDLGKYDRAIECFNKVIEIDPNNKDVYNAMGEAYRNLGLHKESAQMFLKSLEVLEPSFASQDDELMEDLLATPDGSVCPVCDSVILPGARVCGNCGLEFVEGLDSDIDVVGELEGLLGSDTWRDEQEKVQDEVRSLAGKKPLPKDDIQITPEDERIIDSTTIRGVKKKKTVAVSPGEAETFEGITHDIAKGVPKKISVKDVDVSSEEAKLFEKVTKDPNKGVEKRTPVETHVSDSDRHLIEKTLKTGPKAEAKRGMTNGVARLPPRAPPPRRGRTNGLTNGVGRTNGLTNGVGRTNGLTNGVGRTNGLTNGVGRTN
ncbi:MAG TPA: tetratricopeptide repeat protein, partial [Euryarchaeota archaeon]|nr:tetratricopeptide repeat protein [Euryarchaeota archaeon]